jgi:hypothetical protein
MSRPHDRNPVDEGPHGDRSYGEKSIGELVAMATESMSRLVKSEVELAKRELRSDVRRAVMGSVLFAGAAFLGCVILILLSIAAAYGLVALGIWHWAAFLIVAGGYGLLAVAFVGIGWLRIKRVSGLPRTRTTVRAGVAMLRGRDANVPDRRAAAAD